VDDPKPVMNYARQWPPRRTSVVHDIARGVGIALCCFSHVMLTWGICRLGMTLDQELAGLHSSAGDFREPAIVLIIGAASVLMAFRLIRWSIPREP
jgi:hypothetical protein